MKLSFVGNHAAAVIFYKAHEFLFEALKAVAVDGFGADCGVLRDKDDEAARVLAVGGFPHFGEFQSDAVDLRYKFAGDETVIRFLDFVGNIIFEQEFDGLGAHGSFSLWVWDGWSSERK